MSRKRETYKHSNDKLYAKAHYKELAKLGFVSATVADFDNTLRSDTWRGSL